MISEIKEKIEFYKEKYGGDVPSFTANEVQEFINIALNYSEGFYNLKDEVVANPSGNDLRDFVIRMQK